MNACLLSTESRNIFQSKITLALFTYKTSGLKHGFDLQFCPAFLLTVLWRKHQNIKDHGCCLKVRSLLFNKARASSPKVLYSFRFFNTISTSDDVRVAFSNTVGVTSAAGTDNPSGAPEFTPVLSGAPVSQSFLVFSVIFCKLLFVSLSFLFRSLHCLSFELQILISPLVSSNQTSLFSCHHLI
jgi:hypothetical protein